MAGIGFGGFNNPYSLKATTSKTTALNNQLNASGVAIKCRNRAEVLEKAQSGKYEGWQLADAETGALYRVENGKAVLIR